MVLHCNVIVPSLTLLRDANVCCGVAFLYPLTTDQGGLAMGFCYFNNAAVAARAAQVGPGRSSSSGVSACAALCVTGGVACG